MAFVPDHALRYHAIRRRFEPGEALKLDEAYCLAHLPLIAPNHPDIIPRLAGTDYENGSYREARLSLVAPVPFEALEGSERFRAMDAAFRRSHLAPKIAWEIMQKRESKLHITLAGGLQAENMPDVLGRVRDSIRDLGAVQLRLGAPLIGERNLGRVYFPAYPEKRGGSDLFEHIQSAASAPHTRIYLLGYYSLNDHLDAAQTAALAQLLDMFAGRFVIDLELNSLWVLKTHDDLALSGEVIERLGLQTQRTPFGVDR